MMKSVTINKKNINILKIQIYKTLKSIIIFFFKKERKKKRKGLAAGGNHPLGGGGWLAFFLLFFFFCLILRVLYVNFVYKVRVFVSFQFQFQFRENIVNALSNLNYIVITTKQSNFVVNYSFFFLFYRNESSKNILFLIIYTVP
jgi:hypothetical protein